MEIRREGSKALSARFNFIFIFARQKKGSGFFFCAKHAPALRAAGAALRACNPAPPVAQPRHAAATAPFGPGPSLGSGLLLLHPCWHQAASPQGAPAPPWSRPFCCGLCFHSTLEKLLPHPSSLLHALPAHFCPHPKTKTYKPSPPFPAKPWMSLPATSWPRYFQDSLQPPLVSGGLFSQALPCPAEDPTRGSSGAGPSGQRRACHCPSAPRSRSAPSPQIWLCQSVTSYTRATVLAYEEAPLSGQAASWCPAATGPAMVAFPSRPAGRWVSLPQAHSPQDRWGKLAKGLQEP